MRPEYLYLIGIAFFAGVQVGRFLGLKEISEWYEERLDYWYSQAMAYLKQLTDKKDPADWWKP